MNQIEPDLTQEFTEASSITSRLVRKHSVRTAGEHAAAMVRKKSRRAMLLRDWKYFDTRQLAQSFGAGLNLLFSGVTCRPVEAQSRNVERVCQQAQDVVTAD